MIPVTGLPDEPVRASSQRSRRRAQERARRLLDAIRVHDMVDCEKRREARLARMRERKEVLHAKGVAGGKVAPPRASRRLPPGYPC